MGLHRPVPKHYSLFIPMSDKDFTLFLQALTFAADKHRFQRRKDSEATPYINHPIIVAETLWRIGGVHDLTTLIGGLLHDTLEDTATTPAEIEALFGADVLAVVQEVTDDKSLPKQRRKELQIENAPHKSTHAKHIKLADKCSNLYDLLHSPPHTWPLLRRQEYVEWAEKVEAGLRGTNVALEAYYDSLLAQAKASLFQ